MSRQWDVVVIGAGAAGLSAARAVAAAGLSCLCLDRLGPGGALMNLGPLHHLPGGKAGPDLAAELVEAATAAGAELGFGEARALTGGPPWAVATGEETHLARAVILAPGLAPGRLGVPGEEAFEGRGISHCAACDGPLHRGEEVVVAGGDAWAGQEALDLAALARLVTLVHPEGAPPRLPAAPPPNLALLPGRVVALEGDGGLAAVRVATGGAERRLPARAVFVQCGRAPALGFAEGAVARDAAGHARVDAAMAAGAALFAAGDARAGAPQRAADAIADGVRAGEAAARLLKGLGSGAG
ncbi:NAD(P)/FAD-dependent oxidoreductase [Crenalkalicoccus roseus]|uniref:NAD(P)/FAD-dependent oxidoreductase n=1 Tax=Crenalkalicoccus roseus TaxID=1485588 RepID=UPI001080EF4B|nr:NAD(P)/FAD-dependent oxidoreductase [Crenalkalicoccus roseus]